MRTLVCLLFILTLALPVEGAPFSHTARDVFSRLPESIFENTPEGMDAVEKQELLERGISKFWEVTADTEHIFEVTTLPFRDIAVRLHVFHYSDKDEIVAAIGTMGTPVCTMEVWKEDVNGRMIPMDAPVEPPVEDFFAATPQVKGDGVKPAVLMCVGNTTLEARVAFWGDMGMVHVQPDNAVRYLWDGKKFIKQLQPLHAVTNKAVEQPVCPSASTVVSPSPVSTTAQQAIPAAAGQ